MPRSSEQVHGGLGPSIEPEAGRRGRFLASAPARLRSLRPSQVPCPLASQSLPLQSPRRSRFRVAGCVAILAIIALSLGLPESGSAAGLSRGEPDRDRPGHRARRSCRSVRQRLDLDAGARCLRAGGHRLRSRVRHRALDAAGVRQRVHRALSQSARRGRREGCASETTSRRWRRRYAKPATDAGLRSGGLADGETGLDRGFERVDATLQGPVSTRSEAYQAAALDYLREPHDEPFFLFLHYYDAHAPYDPPPPFENMYYEGDPRSVNLRVDGAALRGVEPHQAPARAALQLARGRRGHRVPDQAVRGRRLLRRREGGRGARGSERDRAARNLHRVGGRRPR